jgi:CDI immunity proteins
VKKLESNWQDKCLENLEKDYWGEPEYDSYLVKRVHAIRKVPLKEFTNDDIAMMIRQKFSLEYMIPLAIEQLHQDIMAHGDTGTDGAIMEAVLKVPSDFWENNKEQWSTIDEIQMQADGASFFDRTLFNKVY